MIILETIKSRLQAMERLLRGRRVGVFPGDSRRYQFRLQPFCRNLNMVSLFDPSGSGADLEVPSCREKDEFLKGADVCLAFGVDRVLVDLLVRAKESGRMVPVVLVTDKADPNSLLYQPHPYRFIELRKVSDADREFLKASSIDLEHLQPALIPTFETQRARLKECGFSEYSGRLEGHFNAFESGLLECGGGVSVCPVCGKACRGNESFVVRDCLHFVTFYRFVCHGEFFIMKGAPSTVGMYLPASETVIRYIDEDMSLGPTFYRPEQLAGDIDRFKEYVLYSMDETADYLAAGAPRAVQCLVSNFAPIGHHMVNELPGIQRLVDTGLGSRLENVLVALHDYFDLKSLFPEIGTLTNLVVKDEEPVGHGLEIFRWILRNRRFSVQLYHNGCIQESLARRLFAYSRQRTRPGTLEAVERASGYRPRVWVTLRSGNRRWRSQDEGLVYVLRELFKKHPRMVVVFDGLPNEEVHRRFICERLPEGLPTISALDCTREETIYWTHSIDVHLSPVGNGAVFLSLANKPGVYHSNNPILSHYMNPKSDDGVICLHPRENSVGSLSARATREYPNEKDMHYWDYEVDVEEMLKMAEKIIRKNVPGGDR